MTLRYVTNRNFQKCFLGVAFPCHTCHKCSFLKKIKRLACDIAYRSSFTDNPLTQSRVEKRSRSMSLPSQNRRGRYSIEFASGRRVMKFSLPLDRTGILTLVFLAMALILANCREENGELSRAGGNELATGDPQLTVEERVERLLAQMTLEL